MDDFFSNYFIQVSKVLGHCFGHVFKDSKEKVLDWIISVKDPKGILNLSRYLGHSRKTLVQEISQEYLSRVYKINNPKEYLELLVSKENVLEVEESYEHDFLLLYFVKSRLEIRNLDSKEKVKWLAWIKKKSRMKIILTAEYISVLNFFNGWRFMFCD